MSAPVEVLSRLLWLRDTAALPDRAVADQLGVTPEDLAALVEAHPGRFHESLVFPLTAEERQKIPDAPVLAFTEAGAALLTGLLPGKEPALLALLPAFAEARHVLTSQAELSARLAALEEKLEVILKALQADEEGAVRAEHPIGFVPEDLPRGLKAKQRSEKKG
ncbi:MAG: hypothetical protein P4L11_14035 [Geothrix sp.]|nr:hypothetical protein [Geothrix sp.]